MRLIKEIAKRQPLRAIFRDSGFEIFKLLAPNTSVKVL
jgi:adenine-specific DNA-methyltransferase